MSYVLVPHDVTDTTATIWIGAFNRNATQAQLAVISNQGQRLVDVTLKPRQEPRYGSNRLDYQRVMIKQLEPRKTYILRLLVDGEIQASGTVTTLPNPLPAAGDKPFTILLGSCFYREEDEEGKVGSAYFHLMRTAERPELKFLCGDQVYLDNPWLHTSVVPLTPRQLDNLFVKKYYDAWTQSEPSAGFQQLLKHGATFFVSDDHEYWNNAPDFGGVGFLNTWRPEQRETWFNLAKALFQTVQSESALKIFSIPLRSGSNQALSFCVADTRINRLPDRQQFMRDADLKAVAHWIDNLTGPGVLVVGQALLWEKGDLQRPKSKFDYSLQDYEQYTELMAYLKKSKHSIVVLTGDVHFGRVAKCWLDPIRGTELIEVIASPMQLVRAIFGIGGGKWTPAPPIFPGARVETIPNFDFMHKKNHFATLEFCTVGSTSVKMVVKFWPIGPRGSAPRSITVYETKLS